MRRSAPLALLLLALCAPAADAAAGRFFGGETVDGSVADVLRVEDVDVSRDGSGAIAYLRRDGGEPHVFVARMVDGALQAPERVDGGIAGPASQAAVAVGDGGRVAVAFVTAGTVHVIHRPAGGSWGPAQPLAFGGSDPDISMSSSGHTYAVFRSGGDLRAARMERRETSFTMLPEPLDIEQPRDAGANGRPRVATNAEGSALAVWGEGGGIFARRLFGLNVSRAPQLLTAEGSQPDVGVEDDSSFSWVVYRGPDRVYARRQRGSAFDDAVALDPPGDPGHSPRVALSGRGEGYAAWSGGATGHVFGAVLKDDRFFPGVGIGTGSGGVGQPVPAVAESGDGVISYFSLGGAVHARSYDNNPASRLATSPEDEVTLSDPALGVADTAAGLDADANRAGDVLIAWTQVDAAGGRRVVAGTFDRFPGAFVGTSSSKWRGTLRPELRWKRSFELWGPLTYRVEIDGQVVAETNQNSAVPTVDIPDGIHRWAVVAVDRRGQTRRSHTRNLRVDATPPALEVKVRRRRGGMATIIAEATDDPGTGARASGLQFVRFRVGSGRPVTLTRAPYRISRRARGSVRVSATDRAGNATVDRRKLGK